MREMSLFEKQEFGSLVAKFMAAQISAEEEKVLHEWLCADESKLELFENLVDENNEQWAQDWFYRADVSTSGIKWQRKRGWYKPETKSLADFYIVMLVVFGFLALVYYVLVYT